MTIQMLFLNLLIKQNNMIQKYRLEITLFILYAGLFGVGVLIFK
jgi:hypothetical protein